VSDYTVVNLREVEDLAPKHGLAPGLESRFARRPLALEKSGLSYFRIAPDFRTPFGHSHGEQEEIYLVTGGSARVKIDDDVVELRTWDAVRIPPGAMRSLEGGPNGAEIVAFGAPDTDNQDIDMVPEWWKD
jgi:mannose-6-phosphate isomerase-like protein (cupin superfamily)